VPIGICRGDSTSKLRFSRCSAVRPHTVVHGRPIVTVLFHRRQPNYLKPCSHSMHHFLSCCLFRTILQLKSIISLNKTNRLLHKTQRVCTILSFNNGLTCETSLIRTWSFSINTEHKHKFSKAVCILLHLNTKVICFRNVVSFCDNGKRSSAY
jgi:hypothetical protein